MTQRPLSGRKVRLLAGYDPFHSDLVDARREAWELLAPEQDGNAFQLQPDWARPLMLPLPNRWGYRGDPVLWFELAESLRLIPPPGEYEGWCRTIDVLVAALLGQDLATAAGRGHIELDRYPGGSAGWVSAHKWQDELVPELKTRWNRGPTQARAGS